MRLFFRGIYFPQMDWQAWVKVLAQNRRPIFKLAGEAWHNYRAARKGRSQAEFRARLHTAFEEADECVDWLEYLRDGGIQEDEVLLQEAREIASILAQAVKTSRKNTAKK